MRAHGEHSLGRQPVPAECALTVDSTGSCLVCDRRNSPSSSETPDRSWHPAPTQPGVVEDAVNYAGRRRRVLSSDVPGITVLNTVPYFLTFSCSKARRASVSRLSTTMS